MVGNAQIVANEILTFDAEADIRALTKRLTSIQKLHVPFATSISLRDTTKIAKFQIQNSMPRFMHKPKRATRNAVRNFWPHKSRVFTHPAGVKVAEFLSDDLNPMIHGLTITSLEIGEDQTIVSPVNIPTDQYGNIRGLRTKPSILQKMRRNLIPGKKFVEVRLGQEHKFNGVQAGIYQKISRNDWLLMVSYWERRAVKVQWPFHRIGTEAFRLNFPQIFERNLRKALTDSSRFKQRRRSR